MTDGRRGRQAPRHVPAVPSPYDPAAALERMLRRLRAETGATRVAVFVHEASTGVVVPFRQSVAGTPDGRVLPELRSAVTVSRSPFLSAVIGTGRPVAARADGRRAADREMAERGVRSAHAEPLIHDGEVVGVLTVEPAAAAAPQLLRQVCPRLAEAMVHAWTRRSEERRLAQAEVLVGLIEAASTARSTDSLLNTACRRLAELGEVDRACIFLLEGGRLVPRMAAYADGHRDPAIWKEFRNAPIGMGVVETVLHTGEPMAVDADSDLLPGWWVEKFSIASLLAVPLGRAPDIAGVLTLDSARLRPFSEDVRRLAAAAGAHLGGVVERARAGEERAASLATAEVVRQLLVDGAGVTGAGAAAEVLARAVQRLVGADRSVAYLVDDAGAVEEIRHVDWPDAEGRAFLDRSVGRSVDGVPLWQASRQHRLPVFVEDAAEDRMVDPRVLAALDLRSYVSVPLLAGDRVLGVVVTGATAEPRTWSPAIREAVLRTTLEGALVVENATLRAVEQQRLAQLAVEAHHDPLTGLANRRRLVEQLETTVYGQDGRGCAVLMLDLDRFKEVNDSFGHSVGDDLLCQVGPRLQGVLAPTDLLARMGGDEFAVLLPDAGRDRALEVAAALTSALREAFVLDGMPLHVDASIGIALCPEHGRDRSLLLARADTAMYVAKRSRRGVEVWAPDGTPASRDRLETLEQLRAALDTDELTNHYQPKLDLRTGTVVGVEALVRWNHPVRGVLSPDAFLHLAEQAGLMRRLALGVLERALRDVQAWRAAGHELTTAVNLSVSNLQDVALPEQVQMLLDGVGVPAGTLVLEITEDVLMADAARSQQVMAALRRLGVRLSIDDYGTGYSSLSYLRALPVDELKLDRSFAVDLAGDQRAAAIVRSTLQLSRELGMDLVVEGVEDAATFALLRNWGCEVAQGYHIARPMPAGDLLRWLSRPPTPSGRRTPVPRPRSAPRPTAPRVR